MIQKCLIIYALIGLFTAEAHAMCGEELKNNSEFLAMIPKIDPTSIFVALKEKKFELALSMIKKYLVPVLGSDFPLPKIKAVNTLQSNPAEFDQKTWTILYFPKAFEQAIKEGLISYEELPAAATIIIAHELVHAWQAHNTKLLNSASREKRVAIFEGHATFVQSILAEMFGVSGISDKGIQALTDEFNYINKGYNEEQAKKVAEGNKLTRRLGCILFLNAVLNKSEYTVNDLVNKMPAIGLPEKYIKNPVKYEKEIKSLLNEA